ncbi:cyclophilin-like fold protein [Nitrososphaera sp.]|uniref:cyclophilin-like fold protein n=1 Tax=Nitrososphaera sp. TaxID=1971748 RepID=UPI00307EA4DE
MASPPSPPQQQQAGSVSRLKLVAEVAGKGQAECELVRHLAPTTSGALLKALPLQGLSHRLDDRCVYIETALVIGAEKQRTQFRRGDMALMPSNGGICFFLRDCTVPAMNPIGRVLSNMEIIEASRPGEVISVKKSVTTT